MYSPTISRIFSMNSGSGDSLKVSLRCGCRPKARQMRLMVMRLSPVACAKPRVLQCVAPRGVLSKVCTTTCSTWASLTVRGAPGRGRATFPPCPARLATVGPRSCCRGRRHRPARSAPAAPIGAGFGHGGPEIRAARALPRSESMAASVSRCASKILLHLRRTGYELVHIFLGQDTSLAYGERGAQLEQRNPVAELRRRRATQPCLILSYFIHVKSDRIRQVIACCAKLDVSAYHLFVCRIGCQSEHCGQIYFHQDDIRLELLGKSDHRIVAPWNFKPMPNRPPASGWQ